MDFFLRVRRFAPRDVFYGREADLRRSLVIGLIFFAAFWFFYSSRWSPLWPLMDQVLIAGAAYDGLGTSLLALLAIGIIWIAKFYRVDRPLTAVRPFEWSDIGVGFLAGVLALILNVFLPYINPHQPAIVSGYFVTSALDEWMIMALSLFGAIVIAPLAEEVFFRGWLQPALSTTFLGAGGAIAITAAIFGFLHPHYFSAAIAGLILGFVRFYSGNLRAPIAAHMIHNGLVSLPFLY